MLLFLNDIAGSEVLLILAFILIFFGSKSIPGIARSMGRTMRQIKDASNDIQSEIIKSGNQIKKEMNLQDFNLNQMAQQTANDIQKPLDQYVDELNNSIKFERPKHSKISIESVSYPVMDDEFKEALEIEKQQTVSESLKGDEIKDPNASKEV